MDRPPATALRSSMSMNLSTCEHALLLWKEAGLSKLQSMLDDSISRIKELETTSLESRKTLASETKHYKKLPDEEKLVQCLKLIKRYQKEVDSLTSRSSFSEKVVIELYEKLIEQPDPTGIIESMISEIKKEGSDIEVLKSENNRLAEIVSKNADYDTLKRRLTELEQSSAKTLTNRLNAKEKEVNSKWEEKERNWINREQELLKQLEILKTTNSALEKKIGTQVDLDQQEEDDGDTVFVSGSSSAQVELLTQQLETTQVRVMNLESRNEELNAEVTRLKSDEVRDSQLQEKDRRINELESENAKLVVCLEQERKTLGEKSDNLTTQLQSSTTEADTYKTEAESLRRKLKNYADYEKLKDELNAMKKIEFGASDDSGVEDHDEGITSGDSSVSKSLKNANQKLQNNLVKANTERNKYKQQVENMKQTINNLNLKIQNLEALNARLEADIEKVEDVSSQLMDTQSMMSGATRQISNRHATNEKLSPTSSIIGIPEEREMDSFSGSFNNSPSILPIVTKQRDRFRTRNLELETQLKKSSQEYSKLKSQYTELKADNSKLYERVKLLSSYSGSNPVSNQLDLETPFAAEYEEFSNPLSHFKQKELEKYERRKMSPMERLFLSFAKVILTNKRMRLLLMLYCLGLHALVMVMTIYVSSFTNYITPDVRSTQTKIINTNQ